MCAASADPGHSLITHLSDHRRHPSSSSMGGSCSRSTRGPAAPAPASPISRSTLETSLGAIGSPPAEQQLAALREQQRETQQLAEQLLGLIEASGVMRVPGSAGGTGGGANANSATGAKNDSGATVESVMSALRRVASAQHQQRGVDGAAADGASAPSLSPSLPVQSTDTLRTSKLNKMPQPTSPPSPLVKRARHIRLPARTWSTRSPGCVWLAWGAQFAWRSNCSS